MTTLLPAQAAQLTRWQDASGATVVFVHSSELPILDIEADFAAGALFEPSEAPGLSALTAGMLTRGAGALDEDAVAEKLADSGAIFSSGSDQDRASLTLRTLTDPARMQAALALFEAALSSPRFDAAVFDREKNRAAAHLKDALTLPDTQAERAFWQNVYPDHPYGRQATPESLVTLKAKAAQAFWQQHYTAQNATLTLVGPLSEDDARALAARLCAAMPQGAKVALPAQPQVGQGKTVVIAHSAAQAHLILGMPTIPKGDPDFFALLVGNYTLGGGGFASRLMQEVREKAGLAYGVYSAFIPLRETGPFEIALATRKDQAGEALKIVRHVLDGFLQNGPTEAELAAAKAYLTGSFPLNLDSNKKWLAQAAAIGFYGLPADYLDTWTTKVQAVSLKDIRAAFARRVDPARLVTVIVGGTNEEAQQAANAPQKP
ncbi:MAG: insulinase family protein [Zoogloeaceae bacterium]|nr:insulinase family protein [Zoogloeaceae bacterium]